jgi:hypothetical protein
MPARRGRAHGARLTDPGHGFERQSAAQAGGVLRLGMMTRMKITSCRGRMTAWCIPQHWNSPKVATIGGSIAAAKNET